MKFIETLQYPHLAVESRDQLLRCLGDAAVAAGQAAPGYADALLEREVQFPTGLPVSGGVAIPHTAAEYVTGNTIAVASLNRPVTFEEMGGSGREVEVDLVLLLILGEAEQHVEHLPRLIRTIQDEQFTQDLRQANTAEQITDVLEQRLGT